MRTYITALLLAAGTAAPAGSPPAAIEFRGSLRSRLEAWDWWSGTSGSAYAFSGNLLRVGLSGKRAGLDWQIELAAPVLLALPVDAAAPAPQGLLGMGANYYIENGGRRNAAGVFLKNFFVTFRSSQSRRHNLQAGRFEFADGAELMPKNPTLIALKNTRIRERLVGAFGFTHVGRSFDGFHYGYETRRGRLTVLGAAPTRGVFQTDGWGWIRTGLMYASWTQPITSPKDAGELRVFGILYRDGRPLPKTDNRPRAERMSDRANINVVTLGSHYIHALSAPGGTADLLFWGTLQTGRWGRLDHRAWAAALEAGYQPRAPERLRPWLRAGLFVSSGDADPNDSRHQTFFQVLSTPRLYARFPFFNLMNLEDYFGELILRPHGKVAMRGTIHGLRLRERQDLWYSGGGAYNPWSFGYAGRPSHGALGLATLYDFSADLSLSGRLALTCYYGYARGKGVITAIYPGRAGAGFFYLESSYRF